MATDSFNQPFPRNAVTLPEIGTDAALVWTFEAMEAWESTFDPYPSEGHIAVTFALLDALRLSTIKALATAMVRGCTVEDLFATFTHDEIARRIADAVSKTVYGRTVEEEMTKRQADAMAQMERVAKLRQAMEAKADAD